MAEETHTLAGTAPARRFGWVRLLRGLGVASDPKKLLLASLGIVLLNLGWEGLDRIFPGSAAVTAEVWHTRALPAYSTPEEFRTELEALPRLLTEPVRFLIAPFLTVFSVESDGWTFLHALLAGVWSAAVWGLVGGAICRIALVELALGERTGIGRALRFSFGKALPLVAGPLSPLLAVAIFSALCAIFGLLYRLSTRFGPILAGTLLFLPMLAGLLMTLILTGLAAGWPLIHASVAAEAEDGFDAISRSYAYVHQRAGIFAACVGLSWLIGVGGLVFVRLFARLVVHFTQWGLSFSAPGRVLAESFGTGEAASNPTALTVHAFWLFLVALLVRGWIASFFWSSASIVYLLLRHDVDGTSWNEVALPEREETAGLAEIEPPAPPTEASAAEPL